jgi:hypothetical protein
MIMPCFNLGAKARLPAAAATKHRAVVRPDPQPPRLFLGAFVAAAMLMALAGPAHPQQAAPKGADERPMRHEIWDIKLGTPAAELADDFMDYACGTNGGPPSSPLSGWKDFRRCRPEPSGLREVYFRYDDELEYWAKANDLAAQMEAYIGTKTYGFPIVVSVLIDDGGTVRGIRIVSDPRDPTGDRDEAYLLRNFLNARFGRDDWQCEDLPAEPGETAVSGIFVKQRCTKEMADGSRGLLVTRHLRKPGQSQYDPHTGKETVNQFDSEVRFELVRTK